MLKSTILRSTLAAVACASFLSAHAVADTRKQFNVPAGELIAGLESLAKQAEVELVYRPEQLKAFRTAGVDGTYEPKDAVRLLLKGTPLELRIDTTGAMVIAPPQPLARREARQPESSISNSPRERRKRVAQAH